MPIKLPILTLRDDILLKSWWNDVLNIIRRGYTEFGEKVEQVNQRGGKSELIRDAIIVTVGSFTLAEIQAQVPTASLPLIKKVLADLKREGK